MQKICRDDPVGRLYDFSYDFSEKSYDDGATNDYFKKSPKDYLGQVKNFPIPISTRLGNGRLICSLDEKLWAI
jgi:hypothetical protein